MTRLFSGLSPFEVTSIPKWNVDKSVSDDAKGKPFLLKLDHREESEEY